METTNRNGSKAKSDFETGERDVRPTVIPAPRRDGMFSGWGVRF
jgi:hypothetical protein